MGCQKNIAETIVDKGAELFSQDCLKTGIKNPTVDSYETTDGDHGIIEVRRYFTTSDINWLQGKEAWKDINTIGMVQRGTPYWRSAARHHITSAVLKMTQNSSAMQFAATGE